MKSKILAVVVSVISCNSFAGIELRVRDKDECRVQNVGSSSASIVELGRYPTRKVSFIVEMIDDDDDHDDDDEVTFKIKYKDNNITRMDGSRLRSGKEIYFRNDNTIFEPSPHYKMQRIGYGKYSVDIWAETTEKFSTLQPNNNVYINGVIHIKCDD